MVHHTCSLGACVRRTNAFLLTRMDPRPDAAVSAAAQLLDAAQARLDDAATDVPVTCLRGFENGGTLMVGGGSTEIFAFFVLLKALVDCNTTAGWAQDAWDLLAPSRAKPGLPLRLTPCCADRDGFMDVMKRLPAENSDLPSGAAAEVYAACCEMIDISRYTCRELFQAVLSLPARVSLLGKQHESGLVCC